jgi:arylsulfatase A-like enzyme
MASLFTSLDPLEHGVRRGFRPSETRYREEVLPEVLPTLAELLRKEGYRTFGVSSNGLLSRAGGFAQGFDTFEELGFTMAPRVHRALEGQRAALERSRPYFLWIHYFDPHGPYLPRDGEEVATLRREVEEKTGKKGTEFAEAFREYLVRLALSSDPAVAEKALARMRRLYEGEVRFTDQMIGEALRLLPRSENALVIVTSDHGEQFLEHGHLEHGKSLFAEEVDVPLILRFPGRVGAGQRLATPVSLLDVAPTIFDLLDLAVPESLGGRSLAPLLAGAKDRSVDLFAEVNRSDIEQAGAWRSGRWKYVRDFARGWERLFDLEADPLERNDLAAARPEILERLRAEMDAHYAARPAAPGIPLRDLGEDELERLRALGYVED